MEEKPLLEIQLLGGFRLVNQGQEIGQGLSERLETLLAYLLLNRESPIPRQRLAFLFWPETSEKQARTNLRNLLHKFRAVFPDVDDYLHFDHHALQWKPSARFVLDVEEFSDLARQSISIDDLKAAVEMYRGDLMPDCYDDWIQIPRDKIRQTYLTVLENLIATLENDRRLQEALHYAQILLRYDPIREHTYQHLMRLYAQCGDRASVARTYKTCVTVLEQELDVTPGPATDEAYQKYIAQDFQWYSPMETADILSGEHIPNNLPALLTRLIGRDKEQAQVLDLLSKNRLVTLTGPGGIGKTRLALSVVRDMLSDYRDGIFLVDLAPILDAKSVPLSIADALQTGDEVRATGLKGLKDFLSDQRLLLLLDNCEHLVEEVGLICRELLLACPQLTVLVTSREALKIYGETLWQVPALLTPVSADNPDPSHRAVLVRAIRSNESVELFIDRAMSTLPTFKANDEALFSIGEICRRLEGMPLAIEMAAAHVKTLSVQQIAQRLDRVTDLLQFPASGNLERHATMKAVMDWSYSLLTNTERKLIARLSVFSGSFSLQAVEEICQGDGIHKEEILDLMASLVDKSLVGIQPVNPETRFRLHELVRQYARQKLSDLDLLKHWKDRHLEYFVELAEEAEPRLRGSQQLEWLNRLEIELENLRGALRYGLNDKNYPEEQSHQLESAARLAGALWLFWFIRGRFSEGRRCAEQVLVSLEISDRTSQVLGKVLNAAASFCYFQGDYSQAEELSQKSLMTCKANQDHFGEAISRHHLGLIADARGDVVLAGKEINQGLELANSLGEPWLVHVLQSDLSSIADHEGDQHKRLELLKESLETARQIGDRFGILYCLLNLAQVVLERGDTKQAASLTEESLILSREIGEKRGIAFAIERLGCVAMEEGAYQRANKLFQQSLQIMWGTRDRDSIIGCLIELADNFVREGKYEIAARLLAACETAKKNFLFGYRFSSQSAYERLIEMIPNHLEEGTFTAAWTLGSLMSLEQVVHYALRVPPQESSESSIRP
jgi:predicted ATPase/DNA-binding SARP family transcriptional activator